MAVERNVTTDTKKTKQKCEKADEEFSNVTSTHSMTNAIRVTCLSSICGSYFVAMGQTLLDTFAFTCTQ